MTRRNWTSIKREYVETTLTFAEVGARWGVPQGTVTSRASREHWRDERQQFAAKLERSLREKSIAKRAADQVQFESAVIAVAKAQLGMIARQVQDESADAAKVLKLANALEKLQRIGSTAFGGIGTDRTGAAPEQAD